MTFSKVLLKNIILSDFDCFSLLKDAADAGQIALVEKIMDMEEKASHLDRVDTRFSIMVQCAKNGRFDAYEYFLNQCTAEQLNKNPSWSQNVLSAIAFDNIEFLNYLFNHPSFDLSQTTIELSYAETKDDEKMKTCLRAMTPEEQLIQKSLFSNNDSPEAFNILRTLLTRYVNAFDLEAFNNFKSDQFDMNKKIFLFKRSGVIKKYLSFQESFFTSANNIRKFFYCYNFTNDDLQNQILRIIFRIYDLDYTASEKAVEQFNQLSIGADYFATEAEQNQAVYILFDDYTRLQGQEAKEHMLAIHTWLQSLDINELPSTEELLNFFVDSIIATGVKIEETSQLHAILKVIPTKLGQDPIAVSALNMKIKLNSSENKVGN